MKHTHTVGAVSYGAAGRRWTFTVGPVENPAYTYGTNRMPGGRVTADKIASLINGGNTRTKGKGPDNLARSNMSKVFHTAAQAQRKVVSHVGFETASMSA